MTPCVTAAQHNEDQWKQHVEDDIIRIEKGGLGSPAMSPHGRENEDGHEGIAQDPRQASGRKEHVSLHSLEKTIEQTTKENDDLTRICDNLISQMEKSCYVIP